MKRGWKCLAPIAFTLVGLLVAGLAWGDAPPSKQNQRFPERIGYDVLWQESVAVAADQIAVSDLPNNHVGVNTDGSLFYHGAHIGLDVAF